MESVSSTKECPAPGWSVARLLSPITLVQPAEVGRALLLTFNFFLLFTAYFTIKPIRESLILAPTGGAELKSYAGALQALIFMVLVPAYSALANRVTARRLLIGVYLFLASNLLLFLALGSSGSELLGVVFFLWVGMFNVLSISQTWSLCNDFYSPEQGKRLFPLIAFGAAAGAVFGSLVLGEIIERRGILWPMAAAAALLGMCALLVYLTVPNASPQASHRIGEDSVSGESPLRRMLGGLALVGKNRYIALIAALVLLVNVVNTTSEYMLGRLVSEHARQLAAEGGPPAAATIGAFYGHYYLWINIAVLALQLVVVARVVRHLGVKFALLAMPLLALASYGLIAFLPVLPLIRALKIAENATNYSLNNTGREMLFLPLGREEKYKAKLAVDTFFWRAGDALSALAVFVMSGFLGLGVTAFAVLNAAFVLVWIFVVLAIDAKRRRMPEC